MQSVEPGFVLLVESDPFVLRVMETALSREGFTVISTDNGAQAREAFFQHAPKLFLMLVSIDSPRVTGKEFIESIPTLTPRIPVIFTATQAERDLPALVKKGYPLLQKPFRLSTLLQTVRSTVPKSQAD